MGKADMQSEGKQGEVIQVEMRKYKRQRGLVINAEVTEGRENEDRLSRSGSFA